MGNARKTALRALLKMDRDDGYSNIVLDHGLRTAGLSGKDAALAAALFLGVLERRITLDYIIGQFSKTPPPKITPTALASLRLGVYQLCYMDKVPPSAAVDESVKLVKYSGEQKAAPFVNGVLRSIAREKDKDLLPKGDGLSSLSIRYSVGKDIIQGFIRDYGPEETRRMLDAFLRPSALYLRVNVLKTSREEFLAALEAAGIEAAPVPGIEAAVSLKSPGRIECLPGFDEGLFHVQDLSSQICCEIISPSPGDRVLDVCAAPGGKTFTMAELMEDRGSVTAQELHEARLKLVGEGIRRLGLNSVKAEQNDGEKLRTDLGNFTKILCDVPCSGLGIIRKKPEIRYKDVTVLDKLPDLQYRILDVSSNYIAEDGVLYYSTCTLRREENEEVVRRFLKAHSEFAPADIVTRLETMAVGYYSGENGEGRHMVTLMPHISGTDGFFIAALRKTG